MVLSIVDVSGHGVAASLITAISKAGIARICHHTQSPGEILSVLNQEIQAIIHTGDYLTAWVGVYHQDSRKLTYARAGHPKPLLYRHQNQSLEELIAGGMLLGWLPDQAYEDTEIQLEKGDALLLYTDGASEMQNKSEEMFGLEALKMVFKATCDNAEHPFPIRLDNIVFSLSDFSQGAPVGDDVSLLLLEVAKNA